jgi:hypothetical protein
VIAVPVSEWGRRLSDAIRAALDAGDLGRARTLATGGDGQARSLAKEYALMHRGLGVTVRVLLGLLAETASRAPQPSRAGAAVDVADLVRRFRADMAALMASAWEAAAVAPDGPAGLEAEIERTRRVLVAGEERFEQEQSKLGAEVVRAIDSGDAAGARALLDRKERHQYLPLHDRLVRFMAESFAWVLRRFGPDELLRFHMATAEGQRAGFEKWERMPPAEFAWTTAFLLKQHMGEVTVREDAERFTIEQAPCGSGGRLKHMGAYDGPGALPFVEEPGPLTFGQPRLAVYCSHCPIWNGTATLEWFGRPHWVFENPSRAEGSCTVHIYKRRDGAPEAYARTVARSRERT